MTRRSRSRQHLDGVMSEWWMDGWITINENSNEWLSDWLTVIQGKSALPLLGCGHSCQDINLRFVSPEIFEAEIVTVSGVMWIRLPCADSERQKDEGASQTARLTWRSNWNTGHTIKCDQCYSKTEDRRTNVSKTQHCQDCNTISAITIFFRVLSLITALVFSRVGSSSSSSSSLPTPCRWFINGHPVHCHSCEDNQHNIHWRLHHEVVLVWWLLPDRCTSWRGIRQTPFWHSVVDRSSGMALPSWITTVTCILHNKPFADLLVKR